VHGVFHVKADDLIAPAAGPLERLRERYDLSGSQREQLAALLYGLASSDWAPSTVRNPAQAVDVHVADSLVALELGVLGSAQRIADLGAGVGFPGLALAVALPSSEVLLVDSQARRCVFMEGLCVAGGITNARVICGRAEEWVEGLDANDVVVARALAAPAVVVEYAAPLLREGGSLLDWRGRREPKNEQGGTSAAGMVGLEPRGVYRVEPYAGARDHHLHVYAKTGPTPEGFPRRAGMARKRPLA
jgi:16S rRNA (guanine527-N7)-methyltransferase